MNKVNKKTVLHILVVIAVLALSVSVMIAAFAPVLSVKAEEGGVGEETVDTDPGTETDPDTDTQADGDQNAEHLLNR